MLRITQSSRADYACWLFARAADTAFLAVDAEEISVHGCLTSTPKLFADENNIKPLIEEFPLTQTGVAEAVSKLEKGTIRYQGVLVA
jgi:D-arabinose 1-dehydrogenase-like Zn-dependent alcohol dehydrogenase